MKSKASVKGHPIHPIIVSFPIAFFTGALIFDIIGVSCGNDACWHTGKYLDIAGIVGALCAAVPGLIEKYICQLKFMINVAKSSNGIRSEIFQGTAAQVQEAMAAFLKEKNIKLHAFAQSQSAVAKNEQGGEQIIVTATLLYTEYGAARSQITGFNRD